MILQRRYTVVSAAYCLQHGNVHQTIDIRTVLGTLISLVPGIIYPRQLFIMEAAAMYGINTERPKLIANSTDRAIPAFSR